MASIDETFAGVDGQPGWVVMKDSTIFEGVYRVRPDEAQPLHIECDGKLIQLKLRDVKDLKFEGADDD